MDFFVVKECTSDDMLICVTKLSDPFSIVVSLLNAVISYYALIAVVIAPDLCIHVSSYY